MQNKRFRKSIDKAMTKIFHNALGMITIGLTNNSKTSLVLFLCSDSLALYSLHSKVTYIE